jgi:hypothetical protein
MSKVKNIKVSDSERLQSDSDSDSNTDTDNIVNQLFEELGLNDSDEEMKANIQEFIRKLTPRNKKHLKQPEDVLAQYIIETATCTTIKNNIYKEVEKAVTIQYASKRSEFERTFKEEIDLHLENNPYH